MVTLDLNVSVRHHVHVWNLEHTIPLMKHGGGGSMLWPCFLSAVTLKLDRVGGDLNEYKHINTLKKTC